MMHCERHFSFMLRFGGSNVIISSALNATLLRPIILTLSGATNALVENIHMINSPEWFNLVCTHCRHQNFGF